MSVPDLLARLTPVELAELERLAEADSDIPAVMRPAVLARLAEHIADAGGGDRS